MKKDQDEDVIMDDGKCLASDSRKQESLQLEKLLQLTYDPDKYMLSETNAKVVTKKIKNFYK